VNCEIVARQVQQYAAIIAGRIFQLAVRLEAGKLSFVEGPKEKLRMCWSERGHIHIMPMSKLVFGKYSKTCLKRTLYLTEFGLKRKYFQVG
jgi:hypothetical protein